MFSQNSLNSVTEIFVITVISGGSRIPRRRGRQPSGEGRGVPTYDFAKFCEKLHELRKFWAVGGACSGGAP